MLTICFFKPAAYSLELWIFLSAKGNIRKATFAKAIKAPMARKPAKHLYIPGLPISQIIKARRESKHVIKATEEKLTLKSNNRIQQKESLYFVDFLLKFFIVLQFIYFSFNHYALSHYARMYVYIINIICIYIYLS